MAIRYNPKPDDLCQQSERVAAGLKADMDLLKQVCGPGCPSFIGCPFLAMLDQAAKADVVIAASNRVFSGLPKAVARGIARATIEEDFTPHGIWIFSLSLESFRETALAKWPVLREGEPDDAGTRKLAWLLAAIAKAVPGDGDMKPEMLRAEGLRAEDFIQATGLTRRRKRASTAHSKMSLEELREAAAAEAINGEIGKMVTAITVAAEVFAGASGRITGNTELTTRGVVRDMTIHTTLKPDQRLQEIPVLLPNGTPQLDTVRQFFPRLVVREPPAVVAPYAETRQIVGGFAKGTVDNQRSQRKRKELNRWLRLHALGESASGFVGFKGTKAEITAGVPGMLPPRHHGQNAGDDELRDVGVHVVQDGMRLPGAEIERQVRAKTGRAPTTLETMRAPGRVLMTDGTGKEIPDVLRYGDPDMQAEYDYHLGASVSQALARARGVMRTAENPVRIYLFGNVAPQGVPLTDVTPWRQEAPGELGEMVLRSRVHFNAVTMKAMHDELFASDKAASSKRERWIRRFQKPGQSDDVVLWACVREWVRWDRRPWARVRWQRGGQGNALQWSICPEAEAEAMHAELVEAFGPLAYWKTERFTDGRKPLLAAKNEVLPAIVKDDQRVPGMSSVPAPWLTAQIGSELPWRVEHPPDG